MKKAVIVVALLLVPLVVAQLDWSVTDSRCGNDVLDDFELCDENVEKSHCEALATLLEIDTVCDTQHCTCLPRVNKAYCGNNKREGVEVCDGEDLCPQFGKAINISLKCNKDTCGCDFNQTIPKDYSTAAVDKLVNQSQSEAVCGDKKVERNEDCDPPNTLCTTSKQEAGVCTDKCECEVPGMLEPEPAVNLTEPVNDTVEVNETVEINETVEEPKVVEKKGFFSRIWAWIAALFS